MYRKKEKKKETFLNIIKKKSIFIVHCFGNILIHFINILLSIGKSFKKRKRE